MNQLYNQITASTTYYYNASGTLLHSATDYKLPDTLLLPFLTFVFLFVTFFVAKKIRSNR
jgi:hypothetical protein